MSLVPNPRIPTGSTKNTPDLYKQSFGNSLFKTELGIWHPDMESCIHFPLEWILEIVTRALGWPRKKLLHAAEILHTSQKTEFDNQNRSFPVVLTSASYHLISRKMYNICIIVQNFPLNWECSHQYRQLFLGQRFAKGWWWMNQIWFFVVLKMKKVNQYLKSGFKFLFIFYFF